MRDQEHFVEADPERFTVTEPGMYLVTARVAGREAREILRLDAGYVLDIRDILARHELLSYPPGDQRVDVVRLGSADVPIVRPASIPP